MALVGIVGYVWWAVSGSLVKDGSWVGVDFHVYYQVARVLRQGEDIYSAGISPPYVYPPLLAILVVPLSVLPVGAATILWKLLQHVCLLVAGWLLVRLAPVGVRPLAVGTLLLGLLTAPLHDEIQVGESNSLVLALVVGAIWVIARTEAGSREAQFRSPGSRMTGLVLAGMMLALAVSIKVLPVLLVAYLWWRGPRVVAGVASGGFVALQLISLAITPSMAHYWLVEFPGLFGQAFPFLDNQSLNAFFSRALLPGDPNIPQMQVANGEGLRPVITWVVNVGVVAATAWVLWRSGKQQGTERGTGKVLLLLEVGLVLLTIHLVSGSTWLHHLIDLAVPIMALLSVWWVSQDRRTILAEVGALVIGLAALVPHPGDWLSWAGVVAPGNAPLGLFASSVQMLVVVGLWGAVAVSIRNGIFYFGRKLIT
jgi:alpha-1,2-mannosyltransferase